MRCVFSIIRKIKNIERVKKIIDLSIIILSIGCKNLSERNVASKPIVENTFEGEKVDNEHENWEFLPNKIGKKAEDFIPNVNFKIQYKAEGDLNKDRLSDMVLVIKPTEEISVKKRYTLVLLKDKNNIYHLDKSSENIFEPEYNEYGYKWYSEEYIEINKGVLQLSFYDLGPSGTLIAKFQYKNKELVLNYLETFNAGAGGQTTAYYDFVKNKTEIHQTNTMEEEMPTTIEKKSLKKRLYLFEKVKFLDVIQDNE